MKKLLLLAATLTTIIETSEQASLDQKLSSMFLMKEAEIKAMKKQKKCEDFLEEVELFMTLSRTDWNNYLLYHGIISNSCREYFEERRQNLTRNPT